MEPNYHHENLCQQYLLGELSEAEQAQFEESYFADDALFERFLVVKDELVDSYARGHLTGRKRERFEEHFLATESRRQLVEEARGFIHTVTAASTNEVALDKTNPLDVIAPTSRWPSISKFFASRPLVWQGALVVLLLIAFAGSWLLVRRSQSQRTERERLQNEEAARRRKENERGGAVVPRVNSNRLPTNPIPTPAPERTPPSKPADEHPPQPMPAQVVSLFLSPFSPRDATASNSLLLLPQTREVRLHLAFKGDDYSRYDVAVRTFDGKQVLTRQWRKAKSNGEGKSVTITLDPSLFDHQDYIATLSGLKTGGQLEVIGDYYFNVKRTGQSTSPPNRD